MLSPSKEQNIIYTEIYISDISKLKCQIFVGNLLIAGGKGGGEKSGSGYRGRDSRSPRTAMTRVNDSRGKKGGRGVDASFAGRGTG